MSIIIITISIVINNENIIDLYQFGFKTAQNQKGFRLNKSYAKKKVKNQRKNLMTKFHFDSTKDSTELPLCSNAYDDVTDFKICGPFKNAKI